MSTKHSPKLRLSPCTILQFWLQSIHDSDVDHLRAITEKSAPLEARNPFGRTPLEAACFRKNADAVEVLIRYRFRVD